MKYTIIVKQLVTDAELAKPDDRLTNPSGSHEIEAESAYQALDQFHRTVPIACLEDFEITCTPSTIAEEMQRPASRLPRTIGGYRVHASLTAELICEAVERHASSLDNPGFCVACGEEAEGCEPDAEGYECESCGEPAVFGAEDLLIRLA